MQAGVTFDFRVQCVFPIVGQSMQLWGRSSARHPLPWIEFVCSDVPRIFSIHAPSFLDISAPCLDYGSRHIIISKATSHFPRQNPPGLPSQPMEIDAISSSRVNSSSLARPCFQNRKPSAKRTTCVYIADRANTSRINAQTKLKIKPIILITPAPYLLTLLSFHLLIHRP